MGPLLLGCAVMTGRAVNDVVLLETRSSVLAM